MWGPIWELPMLFPRSWRWRTTLNCEMPSSLDTLRVLLARYDLEHSLGIHSFRLNWLFLIAEFLLTSVLLLETSGYFFFRIDSCHSYRWIDWLKYSTRIRLASGRARLWPAFRFMWLLFIQHAESHGCEACIKSHPSKIVIQFQSGVG